MSITPGISAHIRRVAGYLPRLSSTITPGISEHIRRVMGYLPLLSFTITPGTSAHIRRVAGHLPLLNSTEHIGRVTGYRDNLCSGEPVPGNTASDETEVLPSLVFNTPAEYSI